MFTSILALLAVFSVAAFAQTAATTGYVVRSDYTDAGCTVLFRRTSFKVGVCAPPSPLMAMYFTDTNDITISYFNGDKVCNATGAATGGSTATYKTDACNPSTPSPFIFTYESNFHTLEENVRTFAAYDPAVQNCMGDVFSVEQDFPVCFNNSYGSDNSHKIVCTSAGKSTQSDCSSFDCSGTCNTRTEDVSATRCDTGNQFTTSCTVTARLLQLESSTTSSTPTGTPSQTTTTGGSASPSTGSTGSATPAPTGTDSTSGASNPTTGSNGNSNSNSNSGQVSDTGAQSSTSSASFVAVSAVAMVLSVFLL